MKRLFLLGIYASVLLLNGCTGIVGFWMAVGGVAAIPVAGYELTRDRSVDHNLKPYGAHWIKEGMTSQGRLIDWLQCGGDARLSDGYERPSGITTKEYFEGLELHRKRIRSCMDEKGYDWMEQCDTRCL